MSPGSPVRTAESEQSRIQAAALRSARRSRGARDDSGAPGTRFGSGRRTSESMLTTIHPGRTGLPEPTSYVAVPARRNVRYVSADEPRGAAPHPSERYPSRGSFASERPSRSGKGLFPLGRGAVPPRLDWELAGARSSVDRAPASGAGSRRFESCRARPGAVAEDVEADAGRSCYFLRLRLRVRIASRVCGLGGDHRVECAEADDDRRHSDPPLEGTHLHYSAPRAREIRSLWASF